jgi:tRNA(Ile)-lysidine synthase
MGRTRVPSRLLRKVAAALDAPGSLRAGDRLLVAVSGGPDSTALLASLVELASHRGIRLTAGHVEHGLRGEESAADARSVRDLAAELGVPFLTRRAPVAPGANLEARARRVRYRALGAMAVEVGASHIATGHTRDDQVETVLLRLLRGAGRRGLGGMAVVRGRFLRPLLGSTRADVRRFLAERALCSGIDRTNADLRLTRNRIRLLLVPFLEAEFNPRLGPSLAALGERLRDEEEFLAAAAAARSQDLLDDRGLDVAVAGEPPALARRIVRAWLQHGARRAVTARHVEGVLALAGPGGRGTRAIPGPARVVRENDRLVRRAGRAAVVVDFDLPIAPGGAVTHPGGSWRLLLSDPRRRRVGEQRPTSPTHALFDADLLPPDLRVRRPAPGDRVRLLSGGTRKLQDVLVDAKVPREARSGVPVVVAGADILWVPGYARGAVADVRPDTARIVEGRLERGKSGSDCG